MTQIFDYDLFVIGAGSGGVRAARKAAEAGKRVVIAEENYLGGTCVNVGCVPKKLLVLASHFSEEFRDAEGFGWHVDKPSFNWNTLITNKNKEVERLHGVYKGLLENAGVNIIYGRARLASEHNVEINGEFISAEKILVTVGATPRVPELPGSEHIISSDQVFFLPKLPEKIVIVGGSYVAMEFAGIFSGLGVETHLIYRGNSLLRKFDGAIAEFVSHEMEKKCIHIHYLQTIESVDKRADGRLVCHLNGDDVIDADQVMFATGRYSLTDDLGIQKLGLATRDNATIVASERFETSIPSVYALGDVIGTPALTPVALAQADVFVNQQYGDNTKVMNYDNIPTAVFCQPNIGAVGLTEEEARLQGLSVDVYQSEYKHLKHTLSGRDEHILMRMLVDKESQIIIGMHMAGPDAGEIIQGFAVAVKARLTKTQFDATIGIHPTSAEEFVTLRDIKYSF